MKTLRVNLFIGTPCYNSMVHSDYLHSIISYHEKGLPFSVMTIGNESLITRGRNTVLSYFHKLEQFTHLVFIDADIFLSADDLVKLLSHEKDVIGAPVPLKGFDEKGNHVTNIGSVIKDYGNGLVTTEKLGNAVMILSRRAVNALVGFAKANKDVYYGNPLSRGDSIDDALMYDVFKVGVLNKNFSEAGDYLSEDYYVCETLRKAGFEVFVDTTCKVRHNGMFTFG